MNANTTAGLFIIALLIAVIIFGPLAFIWGLNTLFPVLAIPYTFWTWLATLVVFGSATARANK